MAILLIAAAVLFTPVAAAYIVQRQPYATNVVYATTLPASGRFVVISRPPVYRYLPSPKSPPGTLNPYASGSTAGTTNFTKVLAPPSQQLYGYYYPPHPLLVALRRYLPMKATTVQTSIAIAAVAMSIATILFLPAYWLLLRSSILRTAIKRVHLTRIAAYSTDAIPLLLILGGLAEMAWLFSAEGSSFASSGLIGMVGHAMTVPVIVLGGLAVRMAIGFSRYARMPHAWAVSMAYVVMVGLIWLTAVLPFVSRIY
ncbi:MAG: hypothetical protein QM754_07370 [Tepidisphaeraceae bacterium]